MATVYLMGDDRTLTEVSSMRVTVAAAPPTPPAPLTPTLVTTWIAAHPALGAGAKVSGVIPYGNLAIIKNGDWAANTGPTDVLAYDTANGDAPVTLLLDAPTEAFESGTAINGALWLPWTDPLGNGPGGATTNAGGTWHNVTAVQMIHAFHASTFTGTDIWLVGSRWAGSEHHGCAVRSTDGGQTWTIARSVAGSRFTSAVLAWGNLHVFEGLRVHIFDGSAWTMQDWHGVSNNPVSAGGAIFAHAGWWAGGGAPVAAYEARDPADYPGRVDEIAYLAAGGGSAYAVMLDRRLCVAEATETGWRWSTIGVLEQIGPIDVAGGSVYVTTGNRIGRTAI